MFYPFKRQRIGELMGERIGWRCRSTRSSPNPFRPFPFLNKRREKTTGWKTRKANNRKRKRKNVLNLARQFTFQIVKQERTGVVPRRCHRNDGNVVSKLRTSDLNVFYWRQWKKRAGMTIKSKINKTGKEQERKRKNGRDLTVDDLRPPSCRHALMS